MADKIQLTIEHMIPELDNLVQTGILAKREVKKIIKKRRYYEYQFEKKDVLKIDFFKAIRYEKILNKRKNQKKKELNIKKTDYNEFHFIRRIIFLFKKCLMKFKHDETIWMEFFNFLIKHKCYNILNKEIGQCLLTHPHNLTFWKIAAYNEFENNFNSITARSLFQKSIRLNPNNITAHLEYFIFELKFAEKVTERRKILKGENETKIKFMEEEAFLKKAEENNEVNMKGDEMNTQELLLLTIPEIIWKQSHVQMKQENKKDLDVKFLSALMKYGSKLNYKTLKCKIIESLRENDNSLNTELQIQKCLLEKYNDKDFIRKLVHKSEKLLTKNSSNNKIISFAFEILESKFTSDLESNEIEKQNIFSYIWEKLKDNIDMDELIKDFGQEYNRQIIKFLSEHKVFKSNVLNDLISKIIESIFSTKDTKNMNYIFNLWKSHILNFNLDMDTIFTTLTDRMKKDNRIDNKLFYSNLLCQLCNLIEDEIHFSPEKSLGYLNKIEDMMKNIKDLSSKKEIYYRLVSIIYTGMAKYIPREIPLEYQFENSLAFVPALEFTKQNMTKSLVNYESIKREILQKLDKDISNILKRIV